MKNLKGILVAIIAVMMLLMTSCNETNIADDPIPNDKEISGVLTLSANYPKVIVPEVQERRKSSSTIVNKEAFYMGIKSLNVTARNETYNENQVFDFSYINGTDNQKHTLDNIYLGRTTLTGVAYANNENRSSWNNGKNYICAYHAEVDENNDIKDIINSNYICFYKHYEGSYFTNNLKEDSDIKIEMEPVNDFFVIDLRKHTYTKATLLIQRSNGDIVGKYETCNRNHNHFLTVFDGINKKGVVKKSPFENKGEKFKMTVTIETSCLDIKVFSSVFETPAVVGGMIHVIKLDVRDYNIINRYATVTYKEYQKTLYTWKDGKVIAD